MTATAARAGQALPVGNEGAGTVIAAGSAPAAQALLGKTVSMIGGAMYAELRCLPAAQCMALPEGTTAAEEASWFVNPMTALAMTETMKREGHTALVHTAAASNLGQMLNKICIQDGIGLVNIYGSSTRKQVYVYGGLDRGPTEFTRGFGMTWSMGGWLLFNFLGQIGAERAQQLKQRVRDELKTTFASHYTREVTLAQALTLEAIAVYGAQATGEKVLVRPGRHPAS